MGSSVLHGMMAWQSYRVRSGLRRHSCMDSASCPWARQSRRKARPFPREVFSCSVWTKERAKSGWGAGPRLEEECGAGGEARSSER